MKIINKLKVYCQKINKIVHIKPKGRGFASRQVAQGEDPKCVRCQVLVKDPYTNYIRKSGKIYAKFRTPTVALSD